MNYVSIEELCEILNGYAFKSDNYVEEGVRIIRIANVQKGYIEDNTPVFCQYDNLELEKYMLMENDLLISLTGNVGRVALLTKEFLPAALNQRVACLRLKNKEVLKKYLFYCLSANGFEEKCIRSAKGVAQKNMSTEWLKKYKIPLYSSNEQIQIVRSLDFISRTINNRKKQLQKLDELIQARFVELFGDLKINSKDWKIVEFNKCASIDTHMVHDFAGYEDYPHIGIDSIEKGTGRLFGYRTIAEDGVISGKYMFTSRHIIYSKIRPNLNKVALPEFDGLCSADAYPILVKEGICNREYLGYTLKSKYFLEYILAFSNRTNLPKVNKSQVEGFRLPLPPIELQNQFADFVNQVNKSKLVIKNLLQIYKHQIQM